MLIITLIISIYESWWLYTVACTAGVPVRGEQKAAAGEVEGLGTRAYVPVFAWVNGEMFRSLVQRPSLARLFSEIVRVKVKVSRVHVARQLDIRIEWMCAWCTALSCDFWWTAGTFRSCIRVTMRHNFKNAFADLQLCASFGASSRLAYATSDVPYSITM